MKCPNCGTTMKVSGASFKGQEYICGNCGMKKRSSVEAEPATQSPSKQEIAPREEAKNKSKTSVSKIKKRVDKAKRLTELRQISKDLTSRINDLEIQMDRKVEELQSICVRFQQMIESFED